MRVSNDRIFIFGQTIRLRLYFLYTYTNNKLLLLQMCRVREIQSFTLTWPQPGGQNMLVFSAVPCIIQYTNSKHHIIIPQTHGLIIAGQWALPLSVELLPTATGSYAGVIRSAVGSLNREINVCSTIGPGDWARPGKSQSRVLQEPLLFLPAYFLCCLFPPISIFLYFSLAHLHPLL